MAKTNITEFSNVASNNTDINNVNIDENCPASNLNNALRELMKALKDVDTGSQALTALSVTGNVSVGGTFTSTGIDDNASSTAMTLDSSGNVGIGETDPDSTLTVKGASHTNLQVKSNSESTKAFIQTVQDSDIRIGSSTNHPVSFYQNGSERMRIDSSGNLLVGTTAESTWASTAGHVIRPNSSITSTRDGGQPLIVNRLTSDGTIIDVRKDGSTVGSIGATSGVLTIDGNGANTGGFYFNGANNILPRKNKAFNSGTIDLGSTSQRWKDLYLSGGVYLGGTGSANYLDDYEEGTWTAGFQGATVSATNTTGYYTKIGQQVFFNYYSSVMTISSASGGAQITGLPFTSSNNTAQYGLFTYVHGTAVNNSNGGFVVKNTTYMAFINNDNITSASYVNGSNKYVMVSGHYQTDS